MTVYDRRGNSSTLARRVGPASVRSRDPPASEVLERRILPAVHGSLRGLAFRESANGSPGRRDRSRTRLPGA